MVWKLFGDDIGGSEGMDTSTKKRSKTTALWAFSSLLSPYFEVRQQPEGNVQGKKLLQWEGCWSKRGTVSL